MAKNSNVGITKRLNLGCGNDIRKGWINADFIRKKGIDVVYDLNEYPYPFADNSFDEIDMLEVLEHLDDTVAAMREIFRILRPGGIVHITVPYYLHYHAWSNPEHKRAFNYHTFFYFDDKSDLSDLHNFGFAFRKVRVRYRFGFGNRLFSPIANLFGPMLDKTFLKFLLTSEGLDIIMEK